MKTSTIIEAWNKARELTAETFTKDDSKTARAGYSIYSAESGAYVCDLGSRLEVNTTDGKSVNIWIEPETVAETATEPEKAPTHREKAVSIESYYTEYTADGETTTRRRASLNLSADTRLKDIADFLSAAQKLLKDAQKATERGCCVWLDVSISIYTIGDSVKQDHFEGWSGHGTDITAEGFYLRPAHYNDDPAKDLYVTSPAKILQDLNI